MSHVSMIKHS